MQAVSTATSNVSKIGKKRGRIPSAETLAARDKVRNILNLRKPGEEITSHRVADWLKTDDLNLANNVIRFFEQQGKLVKLDKTIKTEGKRGRPQSVFTKANAKTNH